MRFSVVVKFGVVFEVGSHYEFAVVFTGRENPS
jgi:hypothetical protein